ncbi:hypothetical protein [Sorangium sp. So ce854]|uniref:hypothetical protein n=1 Tax=Sorangium sp. So ce854 TaxID=3133322 RepID=UPI003F60BEE3
MAQAYAGPPVMPEVRAPYVTPPLALMDTQRAASAPLPPPMPSSMTAPSAASAPPVVARPAPVPSAATAPSAQPAAIQKEMPKTAAAVRAQSRRSMGMYVLAPLLALGITIVGVGTALRGNADEAGMSGECWDFTGNASCGQ